MKDRMLVPWFELALTTSLLVLVLSFVSFAQPKGKRYEIKSDMTSVLLVHDRNCPLQLTEPAPVFGYETGAVEAEYAVQNISEVNVTGWELHQINWLNNEERTQYPEVRDQWVFEPVTMFSSLSASQPFDLLELDKKTADKLGFSNWRNRMLILMIVKVKLANGKTYDASKQLKELTTFLDEFLPSFDELDRPITKEEMESQQQKVRDFIAALFSKPSPE